MKDVTKIYLKESDKLDSLVKLQLKETPEFGTEEFTVNEEVDAYVIYNNRAFEAFEEKPEGAEVFGYVTVSEKPDKTEKVKLEDVKSTIDNKVAIRKNIGNERIVGYTYLNDDTLVALVEKKVNLLIIIIPLLIIFLGIGLISFNYINNKPETEQTDDDKPVFKDGEKGSGEIGKEAINFGDQPMFRMKLNCTPTVENGMMNIRIESPAEENADYGFVVKVTVLKEIDTDGNVIKDMSDEPVQIYESPLIFANENIEYCELDEVVKSGKYIGRATYDVYDMEQNFIGQTAAMVMINVM